MLRLSVVWVVAPRSSTRFMTLVITIPSTIGLLAISASLLSPNHWLYAHYWRSLATLCSSLLCCSLLGARSLSLGAAHCWVWCVRGRWEWHDRRQSPYYLTLVPTIGSLLGAPTVACSLLGALHYCVLLTIGREGVCCAVYQLR